MGSAKAAARVSRESRIARILFMVFTAFLKCTNTIPQIQEFVKIECSLFRNISEKYDKVC
jgi:hypothetical protein